MNRGIDLLKISSWPRWERVNLASHVRLWKAWPRTSWHGRHLLLLPRLAADKVTRGWRGISGDSGRMIEVRGKPWPQINDSRRSRDERRDAAASCESPWVSQNLIEYSYSYKRLWQSSSEWEPSFLSLSLLFLFGEFYRHYRNGDYEDADVLIE